MRLCLPGFQGWAKTLESNFVDLVIEFRIPLMFVARLEKQRRASPLITSY